MRPLPEALALIAEGWSPRYEITDRAVVMRAHAVAGNVQRAEEYAVEIEALQRAYDERIGTAPRVAPAWAASVWKIGHRAWGNLLIHGWLVRRDVWAAEGWVAGNVAGWLRHLYPDHVFTSTDVLAPKMSVGRAA